VEKSSKEISADALNHYLQATVSFLNWLERMGRIKTNPLKFVGKVDERGQSKRIRRAFTDDELRRLVAASDWRGLVYFTAARTGLRREELRHEAIKALPRLAEYTQIRAQISDGKSCELTQTDAKNKSWYHTEGVDGEWLGRDLTHPVAIGHGAVREGFEPSVPFWGTEL
jgi:hypothetical protein